MTLRRIPVIPTVLVLAAVATMVWLGFWQLDRLRHKEALLAQYRQGHALSGPVAWPASEKDAEARLYRHARVLCLRVVERRSAAGRNAQGEVGLAQYVRCALPDGSQADVVLGWSRNPADQGHWNGGQVRGTIAPGPRLVAEPPLGGLEANEAPDPADIPNNHLAYAVQWFLFALTALAVYGLALRRRLKAP